ncbi:MAG TPA: CBS domain-containing protein [Tepidiformaceae bacterium]|nr:CBS domain-containing protein [Tepidiformaceae bacterium]
MKIQSVLGTVGPRVVTVRDDRTVSDAVQALASRNIGALVVVNEAGSPCGIISERDIIRQLARDSSALELPVTVVMTRDVVFGSPGDDVDAVLRTMTGGHFRHLPVLDEGQLAGMVTTGDLAKARLDALQGAVDTLEVQLMES